MMNNQYQSYQKTLADQIHAKTPEQIMVMLYDALTTKIKQAKERLNVKQPVKAKEAIIRAMKITDALMDNLNMEQGGQTAKNLESIYFFVIAELAEANKQNEPSKHLDNALSVIAPLKEGFEKLASK